MPRTWLPQTPAGSATKLSQNWCPAWRAAVETGRVPDLRQHLGRLGEQLALDHLERLGYALVERNHRTRFGELDLIVCDDRALVFVEVKARRSNHSGRHWENLHAAKRAQVRRMAAAYLAETPERPTRGELRFDAIGVTIDARGRLTELEHLEGAF